MTDKFDQALNEMETTLKPFMPVKQARTFIDNLHRSEDAERKDRNEPSNFERVVYLLRVF